MNTKHEAIAAIGSFIESEARFLLLSGTHMQQKHTLALGAALLQVPDVQTVLFRVNSLQNSRSFLRPLLSLTTTPRPGRAIPLSNVNLYIDTINRQSWSSSPSRIDVAVVYPVDSMNALNGQECIEDLRRRNPKKIMLVTWADNKDLSWIDCCNPIRVAYDAEADDPDYHAEVKGFEMAAPSHVPAKLPAYARSTDPAFLIQIFCGGRCAPKRRWARLNKPNPGPLAVRNADMGEYQAVCLKCGYRATDNYNW